METSEKRKVARIIAAAMILIPILIMFLTDPLAVFCFLMGFVGSISRDPLFANY